ncbi:MAG: GGDEF domain-containing protein [Nitrospirae bacterium]|nr:GGDEF domain-containing protein [Nitrospirota bacterium]
MEILSCGSEGIALSQREGMRTLSRMMSVGEGEIGEIHLWRLDEVLPAADPSTPSRTGFGKHETQILSMAAGTLALALNNAMAHRQVQSLATTDGLTGLLNKRTFEGTLGKKFKTTARYQNPLSLILMDLDKFKEINDDYGHQAGDAVLREMAQILIRSLRDIDLPARYGGDELAIILPETSPEQAFFVAKRIKKLVEAHPFRLGEEAVRITVSMGLASCPSPAIRRVEELVEAADRALYAAKRGGRNRVESSAVLFNHENVYLEAPAL